VSKIKLLYDVITTMKDKDSYRGKLKVEGSRDQVILLHRTTFRCYYHKASKKGLT